MSDAAYMRCALTLAKRGRTSPNPKVGAVIVKDDRVLGEGYHRRAGEPHAEVNALADAGESAKGADMYVTLEPCCHHGRTPPCTDAVIAAGIARVFVAMVDPDPRVAHKGVDKLTDAGIDVEVGLCENDARELNAPYIKHRTTGMPYVILKSALSLDGRIATHTGDSKWITNERSRAFVHRIRRDVDAVVVGAGTARADDPLLTARLGKRTYYPARVVVTASGDVPDTMRMLREPGQTIIAAGKSADAGSLKKLEKAGARILTVTGSDRRLSMSDVMKQLAGLGYLSVLIEGGSEIAASALEDRVVDKVVYFYAPRIIGGRDAVGAVGGTGAAAVAESVSVDGVKIRRFGSDFAVEASVVYDTERNK